VLKVALRFKWDIREQTLDRRLGKRRSGGVFFDVPVFWTTKDRSIAFSFGDDFEDHRTVCEFDASTLETVGAPLKHAQTITGIALSFDCALLASASQDNTIQLWAFESRQLLASFDVHKPRILILSPNSQQLAYTTYHQFKIHVCNIPPDILARIWPEKATCGVRVLTAYIYLLSTKSSCRPLRLIVRTASTHSTYVILFLHSFILLILRHYCSLTQLLTLLPCAVSQYQAPLLPDR